MKYLSLIAVIAFIAFTFWFSRQTEELTIDQMNRMNTMITQYMTQAVQTNQPAATNIEFSKIYTEEVEAGRKMKAHFKFSYQEPNAQGEIEKVYRKGTFLITSDDGKKWTAQIQEAGDVKVEFLEPFEVTEGGGPEAEAAGAEAEATGAEAEAAGAEAEAAGTKEETAEPQAE